MAALLALCIAPLHKCEQKMPTRRGNHFHAAIPDGSRLSPIDVDGDCEGPAIGMTYLPPATCMTMDDVAPIICDYPADDDGPLSGFSVSLFAEEALGSLRDDARHAQTRNTFSLDKVTCPDDDGPWGFPPDEIFEERMPVMPLQRLPTPPQRAPAQVVYNFSGADLRGANFSGANFGSGSVIMWPRAHVEPQPAYKEMDDEDDAPHDYDYDDHDERDACGDRC
ncbi:hypothetical protein M885DRAFT_622544 [Pelagophyceae sp. CCMP2097]|nr:hypothetical protein M885DRAFT_622544 [Pelagophyceae sp. CCMP2097]